MILNKHDKKRMKPYDQIRANANNIPHPVRERSYLRVSAVHPPLSTRHFDSLGETNMGNLDESRSWNKSRQHKDTTHSAILDMAAAIPQHYVRLEDLATARGVEPEKYVLGLGCEEMAICAPGEDTVTMAAEAGWRLLHNHTTQKERVGLCIVATESGVDGAKPISIYIHELLQLPSTCRVFEVKHACYGGTAALQMAATWTQAHPDQVALVITTDIARYAVQSPGEPTQGAGAIAMLIGQATSDHALLTLSKTSGIHAQQVYDFWRPNYQTWAEVKGKYSIECYLEGLQASYQHYQQQTKHEDNPAYLLFHVPFPKMAQKGHTCLAALQGISEHHAVESDFRTRVQPSIWASKKIGNIYTGSLYLSLLALREQEGHRCLGKRVGIFSYGSGSCSEYFTGHFAQGPFSPHLQHLLQQRHIIDISTYEQLSQQALALETNQSYNPSIPTYQHPFSFLGIRDHQRIYRNNLLPASDPR